MQNSQKKLKVAEIGLGWVSVHRHLPAMRRCRNIEMIGVVDRAPGRAEEVARQFRLKHWSEAGALDQIPWLDEIDALVIGTPVFSHYELIRQALACGKHVLTEKPFTLRVEDAEELIALAKQAGKTLAVVHNFQFCRSASRLLRDLQTNRLGTVRSVTAWQMGNPQRRLPDWYQQLPLGLFFDESPHLFYLLQRFSPGPLTMRACTILPSTIGNLTPSNISVQYTARSPAGEIPVNLLFNFESPISEWHIAVLGDNGLVDIDIFRDIYIHLPNDGRHESSNVFRTSALAAVQHFGQHFSSGLMHLTGSLLYGNEEVFIRFAQSALTGKQPEHISAEDALAVLKMQHKVLAAGGQ